MLSTNNDTLCFLHAPPWESILEKIFTIILVHTKKILDKYLKELSPIFKKISFFEKNKIKENKFLKKSVCHQTFQRLNS